MICESVCTEREYFCTFRRGSRGSQAFTRTISSVLARDCMKSGVWFPNCESQGCGLQPATEPSASSTVTTGDAQNRRVARPRGHAQPPARSGRHAADAGCSAGFPGDTGLAAVELLIRNSVLRFPFVRKPKFSQIKVGCPRSRGSA